MKLKVNEKPHYIGHRDRLRKKFSSHRSSFSDYELIEMLLFYVFRRCDTKEMAKTLLTNFKSLRNLILSENQDLKKIPGIGGTTINLINLMHEIFCRMHLDSIKENTIIASSEHVINYYKNSMEGLKKEQLRIMFLNNKNYLLSDEVMQVGTVNHTSIYPREIIQKALEYGASAFIMVHNHPSGDPQPSRQDVIMTKQIAEISQKLDIMLLDHLIIGKNKSKSFREMGLI